MMPETSHTHLIRTLSDRILVSPKGFDAITNQIDEKGKLALYACHHWIATFITQLVDKTPCKVEAICPFVQGSLDKGEMLFSIAQPSDPNNLDDIYDELIRYARIFCDIEPKKYPKCLHKCVVPIFPDTPGELITQAIVHHSAREELLKMGIMVGDASPTRDFKATWDPSFNPMQSPYPLYALRTFIPTDWRFINNSATLRAIYIKRFGPPPNEPLMTRMIWVMKDCVGKIKRMVKKLMPLFL